MRLNLSEVPAAEPVSLAEAKSYLRIDGNDSDALITAIIAAARQRIENVLHRALITQTWEMVLDEARAEIEIPLPPLQEVIKIEVITEDGTKAVVDENLYVVDKGSGQPGRVKLANGCTWPEHRGFASFVITFKAGYGETESDVPQAIRIAISIVMASMFENRGDAGSGGSGLVTLEMLPIPVQAANIIQPYRVSRL